MQAQAQMQAKQALRALLNQLNKIEAGLASVGLSSASYISAVTQILPRFGL
jgi:hypothetical protein